jgi:two-component system, OmpR family, sensor histidine kinase KdpD
MVVAITAVGKVLQPAFDLVNISLLYLLPVLLSAVRWGLWPSLFASFLGILAFDYFFVPPFMSLSVSDIRYLLNFAVFLLVAFVTGTLAARFRRQTDAAEERERRTGALYSLSSRIAVETDMERVLTIVADAVAKSTGARAAILMPGIPFNRLSVVAHSGGEEFLLDGKQIAVAQWAFEHGHQAGRGTDVLDASEGVFIPVTEGPTSLAVLAVDFSPDIISDGRDPVLSPEQRKNLEAFASLAALAITRVRLADEVGRAKLLLESEKLHRALLDAVSHDLRTPLSSITGAVTGLLAEGDKYDAETKDTLLRAINEGAQRMNRFISNLLDMARIESGMLKPNREWCDIVDIVGVAAKEVRGTLPEARLSVSASSELPLVRVDFGLLEQVLINLLENAAKYSPKDSIVFLDVETHENELTVSVLDSGPPIPDEDRTRIFDKFYRLRSSKQVTGTGLGLSISKAMIEAHGGRLWVEPGSKGGNSFVFTVPIGGDQPPSAPADSEENHDN